jgi:hypothetical protein
MTRTINQFLKENLELDKVYYLTNDKIKGWIAEKFKTLQQAEKFKSMYINLTKRNDGSFTITEGYEQDD